jgi:hypothetical protein
MSAAIISARNPNWALQDALWHLKVSGEVNTSRNGRVLVSPGPVLTCYENPLERVMFSPLRDANPFFHLFEGLWMLAGRNDVESVAVYAKQMAAFSDDGATLHGAYGFRWREFFAFDQLEKLIGLMVADPKTRRAVLTMWAPNGDLVASEGVGGICAKDVPCNTQVYFDPTRGVLDMTVLNRSNDIVWGAYGANVVHMSMLQEFVAAAVGLRVGKYYQFSNNFHMYLDRPDCQRLMNTASADPGHWAVAYDVDDRYTMLSNVRPYPMLVEGDTARQWLEDCERFVSFPTSDHSRRCAFFREVAAPMMRAHADYRQGEPPVQTARVLLRECKATDWALAGAEWLCRRQRQRDLLSGVAS